MVKDGQKDRYRSSTPENVLKVFCIQKYFVVFMVSTSEIPLLLRFIYRRSFIDLRNLKWLLQLMWSISYKRTPILILLFQAKFVLIEEIYLRPHNNRTDLEAYQRDGNNCSISFKAVLSVHGKPFTSRLYTIGHGKFLKKSVCWPY